LYYIYVCLLSSCRTLGMWPTQYTANGMFQGWSSGSFAQVVSS
jgi:hypothetical protein